MKGIFGLWGIASRKIPSFDPPLRSLIKPESHVPCMEGQRDTEITPVWYTEHPTGRALTPDWFVNSLIIVFCENLFS